MSPAPAEETEARVREGARLLGELFIHRRDAKAVYVTEARDGPHWTAIPKKFTLGDFRNHFTGKACLGTYLLNTDSTIKFLAFDLDLMTEASYFKIYDIDKILELEGEGYQFDLDLDEGNLEDALHQADHPGHRWARIILLECIRWTQRAVRSALDLPSLAVITGGGAHVLVALPEPMPAASMRAIGIDIARSLPTAQPVNDIFTWYGSPGPRPPIKIEVFPKQDHLSDGKSFGNLIRLPFGWHHEAGVRTYAIDAFAETVPLWSWHKAKSVETLRALQQDVGVS